MTKRGKAIREQVTRGEATPQALPYLKGSSSRGRIQPEDPPDAYRPFLDALAELLAAEAVRRIPKGSRPRGTRKPKGSQEDHFDEDGAVVSDVKVRNSPSS